jgi:cardiolipin synthase
MDIVIEDSGFARSMEQQYLRDLDNSTEVVLDARQKLRAPNQPRQAHRSRKNANGSVGRAAAGAIRIGNAVGAAFTNRRVLEPVEARIALTSGAALLFLAVLFALFPRLSAYPLAVLFAWIACSLLYRGFKLYRGRSRPQAR